jgi:hypothetical protein
MRPSDKEHENSILKSVKFYRDVRRVVDMGTRQYHLQRRARLIDQQ